MSCDWPIDRSCLPALPSPGEDPENPTDEYLAALATHSAAEDLAVSVLWALSGRQFGLCEVTARPCPTKPSPRLKYTGVPQSPFHPVYWGGAWRNLGCGCAGTCQLAGPRAIHLPGPANEIVTVTIGSTVIDSDGYTLEGDVLYRIGDNWPSQDFNRPLGENGTWSVDYLRGLPVPAGVATFVGQLAKEFLAACSGDACRLPRNLVSITNRGATKVFDPASMYAAGKTGMSEIDLWLSAVNPHHLMSAPKVL